MIITLLRPLIALLFAAMVAGAVAVAGETRPPDVELKGVLTRTDHQTYIALPFQVPDGVERITVAFAYTGGEALTTIDLGLFDPRGFRGWSGGNKARFTLSETDTTPSYLPGAILPGEWRLLLGVPNIRPTARSEYVAKIWFDRGGAAATARAPSMRPEARWYRGDFHVHSGHSDGTCKSRLGVTVPCPVFRVLMEASARGLDFVALTDHNTTSHFAPIAELAPWFDDLLVLPGREITTFRGHANLFGPTAFVDFRLGPEGVADFDALLATPGIREGLISINHPSLPSGEFCMGCGWTAKTDWTRIDAIEVINGGAVTAAGGKAEGGLSGMVFWEGLLTRGYRITAVGGSDSHDTDRPGGAPGAIGRPATAVQAEGLSQAAILAGVKAGRVYIDVEGTGATLAFQLTLGKRISGMGEAICSARGARVRIAASPGQTADGVIELVTSPNLAGRIVRRDATTFEFVADGGAGWVRANVRSGKDGRLLVVGNPVYLLARGC